MGKELPEKIMQRPYHIKPYYHKAQYYETDQMGIIHHSNYIRWFEESRINMMEQIGLSMTAMEEQGILCPVLSVQAEYKSMVHFGDIVKIYPFIDSYNGIKLTISYRITDAETDELRCTGESKHCFITKDGKPISLKKAGDEFHRIICREMES